MKRITLIVLAAILCAALPVAAEEEKSEEISGVLSTTQHLAEKLEKQGNWGDLEAVAKKWSSEEGANWQSWYYLGYAQLKLKRPKEAVQALSLALKLSSDQNDRLLLLLAENYAAIADWDAAQIAYRQLLKRYPNNADLWNDLRNVWEGYLKLENIANQAEIERELIDTLENLLRFAPYINTYDLWLRKATLLSNFDDDAATRKAYKNVLRLNPANLEVLEWTFEYDLQNADKAPEVLEKTIDHLERLDANNPLLHIYYAELAIADKNKRRIRKHYEIVSQNNKYPRQQAQALAGLGDLTSSREVDEALNYYLQAINTDPSIVNAWERIVVIYRSKKEGATARKYFSRLRQVKQFIEAGEEVPRTVLEGLKEEEKKK